MELGQPTVLSQAERVRLDAARVSYDRQIAAIRANSGLSLQARIAAESEDETGGTYLELEGDRLEIYSALDQRQLHPEAAAAALRSLDVSRPE